MVVFLTVLNLVIIYTTVHKGLNVQKLLLPVISLLFAFLGNVMHNIKPNYFAGVRTPWTLESPATWKATHLLDGEALVCRRLRFSRGHFPAAGPGRYYFVFIWHGGFGTCTCNLFLRLF